MDSTSQIQRLNNSLTVKEIAWLAGLIEGEGHIGYGGNTPAIRISMIDRDVIERAAALFRMSVNIVNRDKSGFKTQYQTGVYSKRAIAWLFTIYSFLGYRRKQRAFDTIKWWKEEHKGASKRYLESR